ncbi:unnamed protein product [Rangifer tarandus platyrhynchus]|uniref:Uncharacterized protein n=1 Tax=Rangifer tarandus platyrhynchus TaxID=3082113 RepID=A0ABN9A3M2_RANTA|nr:unnamed protein product [Rangifer tarandus platyrhynchus]
MAQVRVRRRLDAKEPQERCQTQQARLGFLGARWLGVQSRCLRRTGPKCRTFLQHHLASEVTSHQSSHALLVSTSQSRPRVKCRKWLTGEKSIEVTVWKKKKKNHWDERYCGYS